MSERSLCQARASVMVYNNEIKKWEHAGGVQGISRVHVYFNNGNNLYRIVGRKLHDNEVVINCVIMKNLKYNKATPTFHQWRDQRQVYGLNFQSPDDALSFSDAVFGAIENLNNPQPPQECHYAVVQIAQTDNDSTYAIPSQQNGSVDEDPYSRYKQFTDDPYQSARTLSHSSSGGSPVKTSPQEPSRPTHVTISSTSRTPEPTGPPRPPAGPPPAPAPPAAPPAPPAAPAAPPAPPAPPAAPPPPPSGPPAPPPPPGGPPPPGAPPPPGGGPPPPPPPPPPPSAGAPAGPPKAGGGGLAEALANAKLKKASQPAEQKSSGGGGGGIDLMGEMQKKLLARKKRADSGNDDGGSSVSPVPAKSIVNTPTPASPKVQPTKKFSSSEPPAPQNKSKTIGGFNKLNRGNSEEAGISSEQLKTLKQEILDAVKSEIDAAKEEIIKTLRQELSKLASN